MRPAELIAHVERLGWRGISNDLSADSGQPWFSYTYEGAIGAVGATAPTLEQARSLAAYEAFRHPEYLALPTEPAERND